jgi:hypothetical protein
MSKKKKWIIGILISLVIVAVAAAASFIVVRHRGELSWNKQARSAQTWEQKGGQQWGGKDNQPWRQIPRREMPGQAYYGMPHRPFGVFFPLGLIFGALFYLGLLTLVVLGVITLARNLRRPGQSTTLTGAAASSASALVSGTDASQVPVHNCQSCSRPVREDWSYCPYCGAAQSTQ